MFVHLVPEEFAGVCRICIVEAVEVTLSYPVTDSVLICSCIHPSVLVELLVMLCLDVELRPYGDHHAAVHGMNRINHSLRIRETLRIKFMSSPVILPPVTPVHYDVVDRDVPLAESLKSLDHFGRSLVAFAALPVTHSPFRHDRSLACESTITADHLIHIVACYEVPVHLLGHFAPPLMLGLLDRIDHIVGTETEI